MPLIAPPPGGYLFGYPSRRVFIWLSPPGGYCRQISQSDTQFFLLFCLKRVPEAFCAPQYPDFSKILGISCSFAAPIPAGKVACLHTLGKEVCTTPAHTKKAETSVVSAFCLICLIYKSVVYACHSTCTIFFVFKIEGNFPCTIFICKTNLGSSLRFICRFSVRSDCFIHCTIQRNSLW